MRRLALLIPLAAAATACGGAVAGSAGVTPSSAPPAATPTAASPTPVRTLGHPLVVPTSTTPPPRTLQGPVHKRTPTPTPTVGALPPFRSAIAAVSQAQLGATYRAGCPVPPSQLRALTLTFYGFDAKAHTGTLIVNATYASSVVGAFADLYAHRFPIRSMITVDHYGGSDDKSVAADNTAGFNCRAAVGGDGSYSMHAYGEAIDVDPVENPYVYDGTVDPPNGEPYVDRSNVRPGMAYGGGELVNAFARIGWKWGASFHDYQHFSSNGK